MKKLVLGLGIALFAVAATAEVAGRSLVPTSWLSQRSKLTNAHVLTTCLSREIEKNTKVAPSYLGALDASGRLVIGFGGQALGDWSPERVTVLSLAITACLSETLPRDVVARWKDDSPRDATLRALIRITDSNDPAGKEYVIDHGLKRLIAAP